MKDYIKFFKQIGILQTIGLVINFLFYRIQHMELSDKAGYFLVKRKWMWFLFSPLFLPVLILIEIVVVMWKYFSGIFNFYHHWINGKKRKLTLKEKIVYRRQLWD